MGPSEGTAASGASHTSRGVGSLFESLACRAKSEVATLTVRDRASSRATSSSPIPKLEYAARALRATTPPLDTPTPHLHHHPSPSVRSAMFEALSHEPLQPRSRATAFCFSRRRWLLFARDVTASPRPRSAFCNIVVTSGRVRVVCMVLCHVLSFSQSSFLGFMRMALSPFRFFVPWH